jgi:hypothetical protein
MSATVEKNPLHILDRYTNFDTIAGSCHVSGLLSRKGINQLCHFCRRKEQERSL